jgi:chitodextrinase
VLPLRFNQVLRCSKRLAGDQRPSAPTTLKHLQTANGDAQPYTPRAHGQQR